MNKVIMIAISVGLITATATSINSGIKVDKQEQEIHTLINQNEELNAELTCAEQENKELEITNQDLINQIEETVEERKVELTTDQIAYVKGVISAEARGSETQCLAVAQTILDRSTEWGMTPYEVVREKGQFAKPYYGSDGQDNVNSAYERVFENGDRVFKQKVYWFHNTTVTPYWAKQRTFVGKIDNQLYYTV